jgi:rSAM/selenodomain-associated transferase 1
MATSWAQAVSPRPHPKPAADRNTEQTLQEAALINAPRADCAIGVMAKTPQPGRSKTRLCPPLQPDQAAALSAAFLRDTTENMAQAARQAPITPYAAYAPLGMEAILQRHLAPGTALLPADGSGPMPHGVDGFGRCLLGAMQGMFAKGHAAACVLSSDTPNLPTSCLAQAAAILLAPGAAGRAVLGACDDGGYYLLGATAPHALLFADIAWSTDSVAEATRHRAQALGLELIELPPWYDVDDEAALTRLLTDTNGYAAPHTRAALAQLNRLAAAE